MREGMYSCIRVDGDRNAVTVVDNRDGVGRAIHRHLDRRHFGAALLVVDRIHENLVEYLDQPGILPMRKQNGRNVVHLLVLHRFGRLVVHPHRLLARNHGAD